MNVQTAYNAWAATYDAQPNRTRDLEQQAIRAVVPPGPYARAIELGCGTGKNTGWLATQAAQLTAVDFSEAMLHQAQARVTARHVRFQQADITQPWQWAEPGAVNLITCSLILEHLPDLPSVFGQVARALAPGGRFYLGELHPFKQYLGSQARFSAADGTEQRVEAYRHHVSDYCRAAALHGLRVESLTEWFDPDAAETDAPPRVLALLFQKTA